MRAVCSVLGVSRSHVTTRLRRPLIGPMFAKQPLVVDDEQLISDLVMVVQGRVSYG